MSDPALARRLGLLSSLGLTLGVVIGSGIFVLPAYVASQLPDPGWFLGAWLIGALLALCSAFCYAELATVFPVTGGYVVYLERVFGRRMAFVYGWAAMLILYPSSIAGLARVTGLSVDGLVGGEGRYETAVAVVTVAAATALNVRGVRLSSRAQVVMTGLKVGFLVLLAVVGLLLGEASSGDTTSVAPDAPGAGNWPGFGALFLALVGVLWCYEGFLEIVVVAGEVRQPARTLVRALVGSVAIMAIVYLIYNLALIRGLGMEGVAGSSTVAADLASRVFGGFGGSLTNTVVAVATFSACLSLLFSGPRILVAMAEEGFLPPAAARVQPEWGTPAVAVVVLGMVSLVYALVGSFEELVKYFSFSTGIFSSLIIVGGVILRMRGRVADEQRRIPLWPLPPLLAIAGALGGVFWILRDQPRAQAVGLAIMGLAYLLSFRWMRPRRPLDSGGRSEDSGV